MLASERVGRLLWKLSLPAGIGMFAMTLYNLVDTIFIGQVVGPLGIGGLSIVFPFQMVAMGLGQMIGIGGASLISRSLGARNLEKAERTLGNAVLSAILLGLIITIAGLADVDFWLRLFGASETVLPFARDYLEIILLGTVFRIFAMGMNQLVRAEGNARIAMASMVAGALLNIVLDAVFILVLGMGIQGAAIATVISQLVTSLFVLGYYLFMNSSVKLHLKSLIPERAVMAGILAVGAASFFRTTAGSIVTIMINRTLITYGGDLALAAYGIVFRVMMFTFMPVISIAQGLQPILGFSYGAKRPDRSLQVIRLSLIVATLFSAISFLVVFIFPAPVMRIFIDDASLVSIGAHGARVVFAAVYLVGFQVVGSIIFQAIGKAVPAFLTAVSRQILFLLPLILILPRFFALDGVWIAFPISDGLSFILTALLLWPQIRRFRRETSSMKEEGQLPYQSAINTTVGEK
jgi:putative MATE family efflux protein